MPASFISFHVSFTSDKWIRETEKWNGSSPLINESKAIKSRWSKFVIKAIRFTSLKLLNGVFSGIANTVVWLRSITSAVTLPIRSISFWFLPRVPIIMILGRCSLLYRNISSSGMPSRNTQVYFTSGNSPDATFCFIFSDKAFKSSWTLCNTFFTVSSSLIW